MGDPSRDGVAEMCRGDLSRLALRFEKPEAALIDCANQVPVSLNPDQAVLGR